MCLLMTFLILAMFSPSIAFGQGCTVYEVDPFGNVSKRADRKAGLFQAPQGMERSPSRGPSQQSFQGSVGAPRRVFRMNDGKGISREIKRLAKQLINGYDKKFKRFPSLNVPKKTLGQVMCYIAATAEEADVVEGALTAIPSIYRARTPASRRLMLKGDAPPLVDQVYCTAILRNLEAENARVRYTALSASRPALRSMPIDEEIYEKIHEMATDHQDGETRRFAFYAMVALSANHVKTFDVMAKGLQDQYSNAVLAVLQKIVTDMRRYRDYPQEEKTRFLRLIGYLHNFPDRRVVSMATSARTWLSTPLARKKAKQTRSRRHLHFGGSR